MNNDKLNQKISNFLSRKAIRFPDIFKYNHTKT